MYLNIIILELNQITIASAKVNKKWRQQGTDFQL